MKNKGFLLFEVMISVVVITAGLLFIMRAYSSAKDSIQKSTEVLKTSLLLEAGMWEFEEKGKAKKGKESGSFADNEGYSWEIDAESLEDLGLAENTELNLVTLEVFQKKDRDSTRYSISTYLLNEEE